MSELHGKNELCQQDFLFKLMSILFIYKSSVSGEDSVVNSLDNMYVSEIIFGQLLYSCLQYKNI